MKYLLDTCVVSELIKKNPNKQVVKWISGTTETNLFISVLTIGDLHKGIEKLPESRKKGKLHKWVNCDLKERFKDRIINFDLQVATIWGKIQARSESAGKALPAIDGMIAATGIANDLIIVTRNTSDMEISGASLLDPWLPSY
ncbi:MAG: type II toxin-antitoxin system VapC family toxin [Deltaproteobacteria bacterium]|jgi:predicted nucleic acid-binding protein|nr:type II toxin-antitoxin system VapC family toxin [Deltaproteobacteria bacterium]